MIRFENGKGLIFAGALSAIGLLLTGVFPSKIAATQREMEARSPQVDGTSNRIQTRQPVTKELLEQQFIISMIPHQQDAIALADLALTRAKHPEVRAIAQAIKTRQTQSERQLRTWYQAQYKSTVPDLLQWQQATGLAPVGVGGAQAYDLTDVETSPDFDRAFLEEMMAHYQMGIQMSQQILADSDRPALQALAEGIVGAQAAKIDEMQYWYQTWYVEGLQ